MNEAKVRTKSNFPFKIGSQNTLRLRLNDGALGVLLFLDYDTP